MNNHLVKWLYFFLIISLLMFSLIEGKGFGGSRGGGGFKGGAKSPGTFGGSSGQNRANSYGGGMAKPSSGSSFKKNAMSFAAGAAGGVAAYAVMRSLTGSSHSRPGGYYGAGYGGGETCTNNEDLNGTVFGQFRCPLYGFPFEAKHCCGDYGHQYCCTHDTPTRYSRNAAHFGWIAILIIVALIGILLWVRRSRRRQKEMVMIPTEPPMLDQYQGPPFYQPPPPAAGYPPPPGHNPFGPPPGSNPYGPPPGNFNPYGQPGQMPYPPQQQPYNPY